MKTLNRRTFIGSASLLGASLTCQPFSARAAEGRLRVGFLGVAHSHAQEKWKLLRNSTNFDLVGISEKSPDILKAFPGTPVMPRDELCGKAEVIVVESEVRNHASDALYALEAGCHVHVEKPPARTVEDFKRILDLASAKKRLLQVGYMWRFNPGFVKALETARSGWLGEIYLVRATMNTQIAEDRRPEWAEFKGGAMFELGPHLVDVVVRLMGKPDRISPFLQRRGTDDLADSCLAVLEYPKAQATIASATLQPHAGTHRVLEILGTNGTARVNPIEPPGLSLDLEKPAGPYRAGSQVIPLPDYRRYVGEFQELAACIRERRPLPVSGKTEMEIQETLIAASGMR